MIIKVMNKENGEPEDSVTKKEKMLDEKLKKIDEVFRMVSEIYRNGPTRGLSPIPLRELTPPLKLRSVSSSPIRRKPTPVVPINHPLGDLNHTTKESTIATGGRIGGGEPRPCQKIVEIYHPEPSP